MKVNKSGLADVLGVSEKTLTEWQKEDPPLPVNAAASRRGQANEYNTPAVIEWLVLRRLRQAGAESPRDKLYRLQGEESALRIAERRGQLVSLAQLEPALAQMVTAFRSRVLQLPDDLCHELGSNAPNLDEVRAAGGRLVHEALQELSKHDPATQGESAALAGQTTKDSAS
jgi:terminase small subunit / prophage DNA-packing protein